MAGQGDGDRCSGRLRAEDRAAALRDWGEALRRLREGWYGRRDGGEEQSAFAIFVGMPWNCCRCFATTEEPWPWSWTHERLMWSVFIMRQMGRLFRGNMVMRSFS